MNSINPMGRVRRKGERIDGIFLLDKPSGFSSNQVLQRVKKLLNAQKAGHTGSLDPVATGVLPICLGKATKISSLLLNADKRYKVAIQLGEVTNTGDSEGRVICKRAVNFTQQKLHQAMQVFKGELWQIPPMYSAIKKQGEPLYKLARKGISVDREPRKVRVDQLDLLETQGNKIKLDVTCSKGFYIRSLAYDLGEYLGCGAHVIELRRTEAAGFNLSQCITLPRLELVKQPESRRNLVQDMDIGLQHLPMVAIPGHLLSYFVHGKEINLPVNNELSVVRVYCEGQFSGLAELSIEGKLKPGKVLVDLEPDTKIRL